MSHKPLVSLCTVTLEPPLSSDKTADADRLLDGLAKLGMGQVSIPLNIMRKLAQELRRNQFVLDIVIGVQDERSKIVDIAKNNIYGLAIDIGSTNIQCSLFDLVTARKMDETEIENPQVEFGSDVLTRVQRSMMGEFAALARLLTNGINTLIKMLCSRNAIHSDDIVAVTVAGNTIVSHFFLGLDVDNIPISPYIPVVNLPLFVSADETGLEINGNALVYVFPNAGSYVGGDIISGILFSGVYQEEEPVLFIDVGTNVEITMGCRDWIMTGAGAAGPALEGGVTDIGRKAEPGTITRVKISGADNKLEMDVMSGVEPAGICGSGLIDLVSELFSSGLIDQSGRFVSTGRGVIEKDGERAYRLHSSDERELFLTETEIKNFLLSKAAMFSFLYVFVKSVGLTFSDIKKVYVAGALGCGINPESAINIGMLPDIPRERFIPLGNSSLRGAEMVLLNRDLLTDVQRIASMITYREMNEDAELMSILQGAMFIPHTEPGMLKGW